MSLDSCLQQIAEHDAPISQPVLTDLTDLSPSELGMFARTWFKVIPERKQKVVGLLVNMAEDNAELDFSAVFKMCLKDSDEIVRKKAISGLWEFEDRSLIQSLVELLQSDFSGQVRASAAIALSKFASLAQDDKILSKDAQVVKDTLLTSLRDEQEWLEVRRRALESVAPFNTPDIGEYIRWAYENDDPNLKCSSLYAMGQTGDPQWLPHLYKELQNPSASIRYEAATACGNMNEEEAAPYLIPLLNDDDLQVQLATIRAMGEIGGSLSKRALRMILKGGDPVLEDAAREALENIQAMDDPLGFSYDL